MWKLGRHSWRRSPIVVWVEVVEEGEPSSRWDLAVHCVDRARKEELVRFVARRLGRGDTLEVDIEQRAPFTARLVGWLTRRVRRGKLGRTVVRLWPSERGAAGGSPSPRTTVLEADQPLTGALRRLS